MSIKFLSTKDYPSGKITEFNIESAKDSKNKDIKTINDKLVFLEDISFGKIFKQKDNGDLWYINPNQTIARFIESGQLDLFHKWDNQALLPTDEQFDTLQKIGGLPSSQYSLYPTSLEFPALVTTNNGQQIELCLFHFSQAPPFQRYFKKVLLLSDIADIKPSELALSHELRLASTLASEIRMSFFPFTVKTNTGRLITYNGTTHFASTGEIKGNEIISEAEFSYDHFNKINDISFEDITFIIGKWDSRLEKLCDQYRQRLERKTAPNNTLPKAELTWWQKLLDFIKN